MSWHNPFREPDEIDRALSSMAAEMRHERRMDDIREMDVEAWVSESMPTAEDLSLDFDPTEHHERMAVGTLRSDAGRHYESDGFSRRTLERIVQDLRNDGHRPGGIVVPNVDLFDGNRLEYEGESHDVTGVDFHGWPAAPAATDGVLDGEAFVFGEQAVVRPEYAPVQILVRHPDGVAHYEFEP